MDLFYRNKKTSVEVTVQFMCVSCTSLWRWPEEKRRIRRRGGGEEEGEKLLEEKQNNLNVYQLWES